MDIFEITGYETGLSLAGVNYLQPADSFQNIENGFIYRQVLQSRKGVGFFAPRLPGGAFPPSRVMGIFEFTKPNGDKELLVADTNYLYKYDTTSGLFVKINFAGSLAAYPGFRITGKDQYISGVSYPTATDTPRFVFTSSGINISGATSGIFFYDGSNVYCYTNVADNPNYAPPQQGALISATYVLWFNGRINFICPTIAGLTTITYNHSVLYSGIKNSLGNGDKFNVSGSGLFSAGTFYYITGATILGEIMVLNFNRMAFTLEKTRDVFNPYYGRQVPGVLGTDAKFSAVSYGETVKSVGRTGILAADGRSNLRIDNKIPNFTADNIGQIPFNLIYGGFDRVNNQFLWTYPSEEESLTQDSVLVSNYEEDTWSVYDQRFSVLGQTDIGLNLTWDDIDGVASGNPSWARMDTTEEIWDLIGLGESVQKTLAGDDLGFVYDINQTYNDYVTSISGADSNATVTLTVAANAMQPGDMVTVSNVVGMVDANGDSINNFDTTTNTLISLPYLVLSSTPTTITLNVDSTIYSAYISGGTVSKVIEFSAETIPFNPYREQGRKCYVSHVDFLIENNGGSLMVDVYADQSETPFLQNVLIQPSIIPTNSSYISMTVNQESTFLTFVLKQTSSAVQLRLTAMRLYCSPGAMING